MEKVHISDLHNLSVKDKIKVVQDLWDDIAKEQSISSISIEHKKLLEERLEIINSGNATFKPWSEIEKKFKSI